MGVKQASGSENKMKNIAIALRIKNAIMKLQGNRGVSLVDLKKYLRDEKKLDVDAHNEEIKRALKDAMNRDIVTREDGLYKVKNNERHRSKQLQGKDKKQDITSMRKTPAKKSDKKASPKE